MHGLLIDALIVLRMLRDLGAAGDPTLPGGHDELVGIARLLAWLYDLILTITGQ